MIKDESGKLTADPKQVHKEFTQQWSDKVFNLDREKPQWRNFQEETESSFLMYPTRAAASRVRTYSIAYSGWERPCPESTAGELMN